MDIDEQQQRYLAQEGLRSDLQTAQMYEAMVDESFDLLGRTLNTSTLLETLEHHLKGEVLQVDDRGRAEWKQITSPVLNKEGINAVLSIIIPFADAGQILANITSHEKNERMKYIIKVFVTEMMARSRDYGVNRLTRSRVNVIVFTTIDNFMSRSIGRQEGKDIYGRTKAIEHWQRTLNDNSNKGFNWFGLGGR